MNFHVTLANFKRTIKDPILLLTIFSLPIIGILILSLLTGGATVTKQISVGIIDLERNTDSEFFINTLKEDENYLISLYPENTGKNLFENKRVSVLITIPEGFFNQTGEKEPLTVTYSCLKSIPSEMIGASLQEALQVVSRAELLEKYRSNYGIEEKESEETIELVHEQSKASTNTIVLGIIIITMMYSTSFLSSDIINLRQKNLLFRFYATPNTSSAITGSILVSMFFLYALQAALLFLVGSLFSKNPLVGAHLFGEILLIGSFLFVTLSLGVFVSRVSKHPSLVTIIANLIIIPTGMLSGAFVPRQFLPEFLNRLAVLAPQYWIISGIEKLNAGGTFVSILPNVLILLLFAICLFSAGIFRFQEMIKN
jgi:ABC-2 type transport system permease protein